MPPYQRKRVSLEVSKKACLTQPSVSCSFRLEDRSWSASFGCRLLDVERPQDTIPSMWRLRPSSCLSTRFWWELVSDPELTMHMH